MIIILLKLFFFVHPIFLGDYDPDPKYIITPLAAFTNRSQLKVHVHVDCKHLHLAYICYIAGCSHFTIEGLFSSDTTGSQNYIEA